MKTCIGDRDEEAGGVLKRRKGATKVSLQEKCGWGEWGK